MGYIADELDVNAALRAQRARDRVEANGRLQETVLPAISQESSWWRRWFHWEANLTVAGRVVEKGWVVPQNLGIALIGFMLTTGGLAYWRWVDRLRAQDDVVNQLHIDITRLETKLDERDKRDAEARHEMSEEIKTQKVYFDSLSNQIYTIRGMLTAEQVRRLPKMPTAPITQQ